MCYLAVSYHMTEEHNVLMQGRMSKVCVKWSLEDLCEMEERDMEGLLQSYGPNVVPSLDQVRLGEDVGVWTFDGSFGWAV